MDESKNTAELGPRAAEGTAPRIWSTHRGELRDTPVTYSHTLQAAARDAVRAALAHGPNSSAAATAVQHLVGRLGEQHGPQFLQDMVAKLVVELAEATAAMAAQDGHEGPPTRPDALTPCTDDPNSPRSPSPASAPVSGHQTG
jgi:hypothetical protein